MSQFLLVTSVGICIMWSEYIMIQTLHGNTYNTPFFLWDTHESLLVLVSTMCNDFDHYFKKQEAIHLPRVNS